MDYLGLCVEISFIGIIFIGKIILMVFLIMVFDDGVWEVIEMFYLVKFVKREILLLFLMYKFNMDRIISKLGILLLRVLLIKFCLRL